jgi:hypothetical protein
VRWHDLTAETGPLVLPESVTHKFETRKELVYYLRSWQGTRVPDIDFARWYAVLITVGPRSSSGYSLRVAGVAEDDRRFTVSVVRRDATLEDPGTPRLTFPYRLIVLPASNKPVRIKWLRPGYSSSASAAAN